MKPTSILGRYLTKQIVFNFLAVLMCILSVIFLFEMVERLRRIAGHPELGMLFALQMAVTRLPKIVEQVFPFVMMIAAMVTFWRLSKTNEFVVMRAAGVSIWGFLVPVCLATVIIGVINVSMVNPIAARMYNLYQKLEMKFDAKDPSSLVFSDQGLWLREAIGDENVMILQAKAIQHDEDNNVVLQRVTIIETDKRSQPLRRIEAFAAVLEDGYFDLKDVKVLVSGQPVKIYGHLKYKTILDSHKIEENFVEPEAISFWKLPQIINFYLKSGFAVQRHQMRFWSLIISPLFLVAMVLLAAVFALRPNNRRGGVMYLIVSGIISGFSAYFLTQIVYAMGVSGALPVSLAVAAPTFIVGSVGVSLLLHLEDG